MYYLYVKQHNQTLLKYLGHTQVKNPYKYKGSGLYWKRHIKQYGNDVDTYIIGTYETKELLKEAGLYYSKVWNVIESDEWANLGLETGEDGGMTGKNHTIEAKQQMSLSRIGEKNHFFGKNHTEKSKQKISKNHANVSGKNNPMYGKKRPDVAERNRCKI